MNENQPTIWTLFYDGNCALCRMLAGLLTGPTLAIGSPEARAKDPSLALRMTGFRELDGFNDIALVDLRQDPPVMITGSRAWEILIESEPRLRQWTWLAHKLGLTSVDVAKVLRTGAHMARGLCRQCRPILPISPRVTFQEKEEL